MAFMDFLGQGIGGTTPAQTTPGVMGEGSITTKPAMPIGPTYGDIAKGAMQYGSKPGSSAPAMTNTIPGSGWQQRSMQPLAPTAPAKAKEANGQPVEGGDDNMNAILSFFSKLIFA